MKKEKDLVEEKEDKKPTTKKRAVKKDKISEKEVEKLKNEYKAICEMFSINPYLYEKYAK